MAGSSGVGPEPDQDEEGVFALLADVAATTPAFETRIELVRQFEGTDLYDFEPVNRDPFDSMHRRVAECGIRFFDSPHPHTPHCTISGVEHAENERRQITELRVDQPFVIEALSVYSEPIPVECHFHMWLTG